MATATKTFKRNVLGSSDKTEEVTHLLQGSLVTLIDLALVLKQVHWNVVGPNFRSVHLQLDEIIETTRAASDEVAERIVTIGEAPDGRAATVSENSILEAFHNDFQRVPEMVSAVANRMMSAVKQLRAAIAELGDLDPISEDLLIGVSAQLEKHLWMVQAQEV